MGWPRGGGLVVLLLCRVERVAGFAPLRAAGQQPGSRWSTRQTRRWSLLEADQAEAMARRAEEERLWLEPRSEELLAVDEATLASGERERLIKARSKKLSKPGSGFGAGKKKKTTTSGTAPHEDRRLQPDRTWDLLASARAETLRTEGVVRIEAVLTPKTTVALLARVLEARTLAYAAYAADKSTADDMFGIEPERPFRSDVLLSIWDDDESPVADGRLLNPVSAALRELLGAESSPVGALFARVCGDAAPLYELCSLITEPGAARQTAHPDTPFQRQPHLYCAFVALQDVTLAMGPTTFLPKSHTRRFADLEGASDAAGTIVAKMATLRAGDAAIFDSRCVHAGAGNDALTGSTRALFNVSFRDAKVQGDLGYKGSLRLDYLARKITLRQLRAALEKTQQGAAGPGSLKSFGDGLPR